MGPPSSAGATAWNASNRERAHDHCRQSFGPVRAADVRQVQAATRAGRRRFLRRPIHVPIVLSSHELQGHPFTAMNAR